MKKSELDKEALDLLEKNILGVFATVSEENKPEASLMMFLADEELNFYFVTRRHTRKFENLSKNRRVAFVIGTNPEPNSLQGEGDAVLLEDGAEDFLRELNSRPDLQKAYFGPFLKLAGVDLAVFKVKTDWLRFLHWDPSTNMENYSQLLPQ